jgi:hypothetical protein
MKRRKGTEKDVLGPAVVVEVGEKKDVADLGLELFDHLLGVPDRRVVDPGRVQPLAV